MVQKFTYLILVIKHKRGYPCSFGFMHRQISPDIMSNMVVFKLLTTKMLSKYVMTIKNITSTTLQAYVQM